MKLKTFLIAAFFLSSVSFDTEAKITFKTNETCTLPNYSIDIRESEHKIVVSYEFRELTEIKDRETGRFLYHQIPGFGQCSDYGKPKLPMRVDTYPVPDGYDVILSVVTKGGFETVDCDYIGIGDMSEEPETIQASKYSPVEPYSGYFPKSSARIGEEYTLQGEKYIDVAVCPIQYDYVNQTAKIYNRLVYSLNFVPKESQNLLASDTPIFDGFTSYLKLHPITGNLRAYDPLRSLSSIGYVIVTTDAIGENVKNFIEWKRTLGYKTYLITKKKWNSSAEITEAVRDCRKQNKNIRYLLLIGNYIDVPSTNILSGQPSMSKYPDHLTDSKYGTMNDDEYIPDIYIGRIQAYSSNVEDILNKIITSEMCPPNDQEFYRNAIHASVFQDMESFPGIEDARFVYTSEELRNYVSQFGINAKRVYNTHNNATPIRYSNQYATGDSIPIELRAGNFNWESTSADIYNPINNGCFYVLYHGHGEYDRWIDMKFNNSTLPYLNNFERYPVFFNITCRNGQFNKDCMATRLVGLRESGASAVFAASEYSWKGYSDSFIEGMFDAIWPDPGIFPTFGKINQNPICPSSDRLPLFHLGPIMQQGLLRMKEQWVGISNENVKNLYEVYHLFGDPSMIFYTDVPQQFTNVTIERSTNQIHVDTGGEVGVISFYNPNTGAIYRQEGCEADYITNSPNQTSVCITGRNRWPYLDIYNIVPEDSYFRPRILNASVQDGAQAEIKIFSSAINNLYEIEIFDCSGNHYDSIQLINRNQTENYMMNIGTNHGVYVVALKSNGVIIDTYKLIK